MPTFSRNYPPGTTVQQLGAVNAADVVGRVVRLVDEHYTVTAEDGVIYVTSDITGTKTLTFAIGRDGQVVRVVMPVVPGAGDYESVGLVADPGNLDAAEDNYEVMYNAERDEWNLLLDGVA